MSLLHTLGLASQALNTQSRSLETIAENLAHADDPHYSRRRVVRQSLPGAWSAGGVAARSGPVNGAAPRVAGVVRERDQLVERRLRQATAERDAAEAMEKVWRSLEDLLDEPSGAGSISRLWNDLEQAVLEWTGRPDDSGVRRVVVERASDLAAGIQKLAQGLSEIKQSEEEALDRDIERVKELLRELARLNGSIRQAERGFGAYGEIRYANDLRDRRDAILRELSAFAPFTVRETASDTKDEPDLRIELNGKILVQGDTVIPDLDDYWRSIDLEKELAGQSGLLEAHLDVQGKLGGPDEPGTLRWALETMAKGLQEKTLELLGVELFSTTAGPSVAENLTVHPELLENPSQLQASEDQIRAWLLWLQGSPSDESTGATEPHPLETYRNEIVAGVGEWSRAAERARMAAEDRVTHLEAIRQSEVGVSPDEEMIALVATEKAYAAAAQLVRALDQALGTVIELLGGAGR